MSTPHQHELINRLSSIADAPAGGFTDRCAAGDRECAGGGRFTRADFR